MDDYTRVLDELETMIRNAKTVPLSSSAMIPRDEALALLQSIRVALPKEHERAREVLAERDTVIAEAQEQSVKILQEAGEQRAKMLSKAEVVRAAEQHAAKLLADAETAATKLKVQADDYVDAKLANFEILLSKTLKTVNRGREELRRRLEAHQDEVAPLNLEDSAEFSGEIQIDPGPDHHMP